VKIPGINQTGVPGAEQISLGAISSAATAKMQTNSALTKVVNDYQTKIVKAETDEEYSRLANGFSRDTSEAWQNIQDQDRVDANGAPTHGTMLEQYQSAHAKIAKDYSGRVKFNPNKGAFTQFSDQTLTRNIGAVRGEVGRRTIAHLSGAYEQSRIDLMQSPNGMLEFAEAQQKALEVGLISAGKMATDFDAFQHEHHTNRIMSEFQSERDLGRGQEYLDGIELPPTFDEGERQQMADRMNADLRNDQILVDREIARVAREAKELEAKTMIAARKGKTLLESGRPLTEDQFSQINNTISQLTDPDNIEQMEISLDVYSNVQSLMSMTREERTVALNNSLEDIIDNRDLIIKQSTQKAYRAIEQSIADDPHQAYLMYGGGEPIEKITKDNIAQSLATAQDNQIKVSAWIGEDAPPMSLSQLNDLKRIGVPALDDILTAYGKEEAEKVLNLLYKEDAGEMAVVGSLALQSDGEASYNAYLAGASTLNANPDYKLSGKLSLNKDTPRSLFYDATAGLFETSNTKAEKSMQLVADTIYIGLAEAAGLQPGDPELNADLYEQAIKLAVGNIVDYGDNKILLPSRNMTLEQFETTIDSLTMEQINEMGGFADMPKLGIGTNLGPALQPSDLAVLPDAMLTNLKSGQAKLVQHSEFGQYQVFYGGRPVTNAAGTVFILDLSEK
jgi:hypothetical protein